MIRKAWMKAAIPNAAVGERPCLSCRYSAIPPAARSEVIPVISAYFSPVRERVFGAFSFGSGDQRLNYDTTRAGIQATATPFSRDSLMPLSRFKTGSLDTGNADAVE